MKTVEEMIAELQRRGPIDEAEFYRAEGPLPGRQLIRSALQAISGEEGWGGERYFGSVLERCGCHPEEGDSSKKVRAYETARQMLVAGPRTREEMDALLEKAGL